MKRTLRICAVLIVVAGGSSAPQARDDTGKGSASGGDGTQTEDELYVGSRVRDRASSKTGQPSAAGSKPARPAVNLMARPAEPAAVQGPGAVVIPQKNCGTVHTGWVDAPGG